MAKRIYLDYAATTPVHPRVFEAMKPYLTEKFGNPGSLHSFGQEAIAAVDASRETIARAIGADFREIIFTGSATEANNLALRGIANGVRYQVSGIRCRIIVSAIEHESILETARDLERDGVEVVYLPVDRSGVVDLKKLRDALDERTVLVSVMYANNEIGVVQPIAEIAKAISDFKHYSQINDSNRSQSTNGRESTNKTFADSDKFVVSYRYPLLHTDAAQAFQFLNCNVNDLDVDLMTLSAHKIYGPKGIGTLYVRTIDKKQLTIDKGLSQGSNVKGQRFASGALAPLATGGGQEFGLRSGTENVPAIVGFAKAVELLGARLPAGRQELENKRIAGLRDNFWQGLKKICPKAEWNGFGDVLLATAHSLLPNILNVYFPDHLAEELLTKFDLNGLAASSGSACRSRAMESSHVIEALGYSKDRAKRSIRFSFGRPTTRKEIKEALAIIKERS